LLAQLLKAAILPKRNYKIVIEREKFLQQLDMSDS
jgi:hypothetical protein